jgi:hypothetical protein
MKREPGESCRWQCRSAKCRNCYALAHRITRLPAAMARSMSVNMSSVR